MARIVFGMNVSLDGYVDHTGFAPDPELFGHWTEHVRGLSGSVYGRRIYGDMRYWDEDRPEWTAADRVFAAHWRALPKWVASRTLTEVGPNATLVRDGVAEVRRLRDELPGEVSVAGPDLAHAVGAAGLIDEYRLYVHPAVLGGGRPFFAGPRPPLRFIAADRIGQQVIRLTCVPA